MLQMVNKKPSTKSLNMYVVLKTTFDKVAATSIRNLASFVNIFYLAEIIK